MLRFLAFATALIGLIGYAAELNAEPARAYLSVFQSGQVLAADAASGAVLQSISVEDRAGIAALASSGSDGKLFVIDGTDRSRLRIFDPKTYAVVQEERFGNRFLGFSSEKLLHLSRDGKWLFIYTYSYADAAHG